MTTYVDIFEMLEAVRTHRLNKGESIVATCSVRGTHVGFATADTQGPATRWTISVADLKASCGARTSDEAAEIRRRMSSHSDRRELLMDLRSGKLVLDERPYDDPSLKEALAKAVEPSKEPENSDDLEDFMASLQG